MYRCAKESMAALSECGVRFWFWKKVCVSFQNRSRVNYYILDSHLIHPLVSPISQQQIYPRSSPVPHLQWVVSLTLVEAIEPFEEDGLDGADLQTSRKKMRICGRKWRTTEAHSSCSSTISSLSEIFWCVFDTKFYLTSIMRPENFPTFHLHLKLKF